MPRQNIVSKEPEGMNRHTVYIGIGSNVGDRFTNLQQAVDMLALVPGTSVSALSRVYMTEPVGEVGQDRFFNAVVLVDTTLTPEALRAHCKAIEQKLGRPEHYRRWSSRTIDLDILFYDDLCINSDFLVIPHNELHRRKFVLLPLLDIDNPVHPLFHCRVADLLKTCGDASVPIRLKRELTAGTVSG